MTKDQKVLDVINTVNDKRKFYSKTEYVQMVTVVWDGLEAVRNIAQEGAPTQQEVGTISREVLK